MTLPRILSVPDEFQVDASDRFSKLQLEHILYDLAAYGAVQPRMLRLIRKEKWPSFAPKKGDWRWLYLARCADPEIVKIGISTDPVQRMVSLNSSVPPRVRVAGAEYNFVLVGAMPCCREQHEAFLCEMFADSLAAGREWFRDTVATRILCWHFARIRSAEAPRAKRTAIGTAVSQMFVGLRYVSLGIEPRFGYVYGLNEYGRRCGICRSRRHTKRSCPRRNGNKTEAA